MAPDPASFETLSDAEYDRRARQVFAAVEETVDRFLQEDVIDIDASRTGGLMELQFPDGGTIVLNTQPPLHELWLAAPSGGFHFKAVAGRWVDSRNGLDLFDVLSVCASEQGAKELRFVG